MVTGRAPHKEIEDDPGAEVRLELARAAADGEEGVEASDLEVKREGPSYSYLTLERLADEEPGREIHWLLGADMAAALESWERPERVVELARLGVVPRPGTELDAGKRGAGAGRCRRSGRDTADATLRSVLDTDQGTDGGRAAAPAPGSGSGDRVDRGAGAVPVTAERAGERTRAAEESERLARTIAEIVDDKGGTEMVALDVRELVGYTDFLVICTARNERQAKAIHDEVHHRLKRDGRLPARVEGEREAEWLLADYLDCILHVFTPETRERYRLEVLWGEARAARALWAGLRARRPRRS